MPKPTTLISANLLACEHVLIEQDRVLSVIRLSDIIYVKQPPPSLPAELFRVQVRLVFIAKFNAPDGTPVSVVFRSTAPNGTEKVIATSNTTLKADDGVDEIVPRGINITLNVALKPSGYGVYYYAAEIDGEEVAKACITLLEEKEKAPDDQPTQS
jgi:hypothetical protein